MLERFTLLRKAGQATTSSRGPAKWCGGRCRICSNDSPVGNDMICSMTRNVQFLKRLMLFVGVLLTAGCEWSNDDPSDHGPQAVVQQPATVSVAIAGYSEIVERIDSHRGKVVVLDCWSTSCPPCIKEFPGLVSSSKSPLPKGWGGLGWSRSGGSIPEFAEKRRLTKPSILTFGDSHHRIS